MDLIRNILLALEADERSSFLLTHDYIMPVDTDRQTFIGHLHIMEDAGYLLPLTRSQNHPSVMLEISNSGHDFLDSIRDPMIWRKTKDAANKAGGWTAKLLGEIAAGIVRGNLNAMGVPTS